jgi:hypothetical protein
MISRYGQEIDIPIENSNATCLNVIILRFDTQDITPDITNFDIQ